MKRIVAVTGGIACGKSTVAITLGKLGCEILDTDAVAHSLQRPDAVGTKMIADAFGSSIIASDGSVDRRKLGEIVFASRDALSKLNEIIHPLIMDEVVSWTATRKDDSVCAVLVPLLFEAKFDRVIKWDVIVAVICSEDEQIKRIMKRGFTRDEALARIASQMPCREKAARSDFVINNNGSISALEDEVKRVLQKIKSS